MLFDENCSTTDALESVLRLFEYIERYKPVYLQTNWLTVRSGVIDYIRVQEERLLLEWYALFGALIGNDYTLKGVSLYTVNESGGTRSDPSANRSSNVIY
jgi:hypothetical protein